MLRNIIKINKALPFYLFVLINLVYLAHHNNVLMFHRDQELMILVIYLFK